MNKEDYVSFETATLLKEKGFDWKLPFIYVSIEKDKKVHLLDTIDNYNDDHIEYVISAPTIQMAIKWLREVHELQCQIDCPLIIFNWRYGIRDLNKDEWVTPRNIGDYDTYEKACEAAIKYCLENLI